MPIYEYQCEDCENNFELFFKSFNSIKEPKCPICDSANVGKKLSKITFKFGGALNNS